MRRENIFKRLKDGGLGLQHLFLKQLVMRLMFFRGSGHPLLEQMKQYMGYNPEQMKQYMGYNYLPTFTMATHCKLIKLSGFYREVVDSINFLSLRFSREYIVTVSKRKLYADLTDVLFPVPLYRQIPSDWPGGDILQRVKKMPIRSKLKTFYFKLHSNTLPVKEWLAKKGFFVPWSTHCRFCKVPETIDHVFVDCTEAQFFWDDLGKRIGKDLRINPHTIRFLPLHSEETMRCDIICVVGLFSLWKLRMLDRNEEPLTPPMLLFQQEMLHMKNALSFSQTVPEWLRQCL
ncbi:uncharacterized protein LOC135387955 [Ornithodoros turicata]|uniref:uncharacterized protein LOC135387955 n=1 Tax=Ornithodoros turicata TaxID=34597 RepID=UPI0031386A86